ncbi:unnamed protein product [Vicia faba]|uniref:Uncharacterized protein n=1 Tax=Vicia faba TaxID=3906 RepID=A0AAV0YTW5_VICFA|nr:unnamed protein product [Vicia faba]
MHRKNVFINTFNTVMNVKDKTKDNKKAREDLAKLCFLRDLELQPLENGKNVGVPMSKKKDFKEKLDAELQLTTEGNVDDVQVFGSKSFTQQAERAVRISVEQIEATTRGSHSHHYDDDLDNLSLDEE